MDSRSVTALIDSLGSGDRHECAEAAVNLGHKNAVSALPKLRALSTNADPVVSLAGMFACWKLGEDRIEIDRVLSALKSEDESVVQQAVHTVSAIGDSLIPRLKPLLRREPETAMLALRMLEEIGGRAAFELIRTVDSDDGEVRELIDEILEEWQDES